MEPVVFYHSPCPDGFTAAWVVSKAHPRAEFIPMSYKPGEFPDQARGKYVIVVDYSWERETMLELAKVSKSLLVLDHHATREAALKDIPGCHFDITKSGARLAWECFFPTEPVPPLVQYVEDRDLWSWKLKDSKEINAAITSYDYTFENWNYLNDRLIHDWYDVRQEGAAILRNENQMVNLICKNAVPMKFFGIETLVVNTPVLQSEVGNALAKKTTSGLSVSWFEKEPQIFTFSLRSTENGPDCGVLAKKFFGGGGHAHAAGFTAGRNSEPLDGALEIL